MKKMKSFFFVFGILLILVTNNSCTGHECYLSMNCKDNSHNRETCTCECLEGYKGAFCELFDKNKVQFLLDSGNTPKHLFNGGIPLDSLYGKFYEGGIIFNLNTNNGRGKVAAKEDAPNTMFWQDAMNYCNELVLNGKDDWRLPNEDELNLMWLNLADSDNDGVNLGVSDPTNLGGFDTGVYWSSTTFGNFLKSIQQFNSGSQGGLGTNNNNHVRAVRSF